MLGQKEDEARRRSELGEFLRTRRARLSPEHIGFPTGMRRRTPGLRREEVAVAAGVSTTWYTYLEQGRDIRVSHEVLESIADALHLNSDERMHLFLLAESSTVSPPQRLNEELPISYQRVLDQLGDYPAYIRGKRMDILAWNTAAQVVFGDFAKIPDQERNFLWLLFTDTSFRQLFIDHEQLAQEMLEVFREMTIRYLNAPWLNEFIEQLSKVSPTFQRSWQGHNVRRKTTGEVVRELIHPDLGKLSFSMASFQISGDPDIQCCIFTTTPNSETAIKLHQRLQSFPVA